MKRAFCGARRLFPIGFSYRHDVMHRYDKGYKDFLIIYKIHSFYFYAVENYYACIGNQSGHGDRPQGDKVSGSDTHSARLGGRVLRRAAAVCAFVGTLTASFSRRMAAARLDGRVAKCAGFERAGQPTSLGLLPFKVSACPASNIQRRLCRQRLAGAPFSSDGSSARVALLSAVAYVGGRIAAFACQGMAFFASFLHLLLLAAAARVLRFF